MLTMTRDQARMIAETILGDIRLYRRANSQRFDAFLSARSEDAGKNGGKPRPPQQVKYTR